MFTDKKYVAKKIKYYRKLKGYTQAELGELIEISDKHVCKIENATYMPSLETFLKLVKVLQINLNEFGLDITPSENQTRNKFIELIYNCTNSELEFLYNCCNDINKNLKMLRIKNKF